VARELPSWRLVRFIEALDDWARRENPDEDVRLIVAAWAFGRQQDPYQGMGREQGHPNLWFGIVPDTATNDDAVTCTCIIDARLRIVWCDNFTALPLPR
jgi:hypothetical protein